MALVDHRPDARVEALVAGVAPVEVGGERRLVSALHEVLGNGAVLLSLRVEDTQQSLLHLQHAQATDALVGASVPEWAWLGSLERGADGVRVQESGRYEREQEEGHV